MLNRNAVCARIAGGRTPAGLAPLRPRSLVIRRFKVRLRLPFPPQTL